MAQSQQDQIKVDAQRVASMRRMLADPEQGAAAVAKRFGEGAENSDEFQAAQRQVKANQSRAREQREAADRQAQQQKQAQRQAQTERQREASQRERLSRERINAANKTNIERKEAQSSGQSQRGPAEREGMSM